MRRLAIVTAVLATLAAAPAASAKGLIEATACGANGCTTSKSEPLLRQLMNGGETAKEPYGEPFVAIEFVHGHGGEELARQYAAYAPESRLFGVEDGNWITTPADMARAFAELTKGVRPFPPERLSSVWTGELTKSDVALPAVAPEPVRAPVADDGGFDWRIVLLPAIPLAALIAAGLFVLRGRRWSGA